MARIVRAVGITQPKSLRLHRMTFGEKPPATWWPTGNECKKKLEIFCPPCSAVPPIFFAGWPIFSVIPWMPLSAKCAMAKEEKTAIGVQPVRTRWGHCLRLNKLRAVDPGNDAGEMVGKWGRILKKGGLLARLRVDRD